MRDVDFWKGLCSSTLRDIDKTETLINKLQGHVSRLSPGNKKLSPRSRRFRDRLKSQLARANRKSLTLNSKLEYYTQQIQYLQDMSRFERVLKFPVI